MKNALFFFLYALTLATISAPQAAWAQQETLSPEAHQIYARYENAVVQVRVISRGAEEKSTLGSGFFISADGLLATNYHVVSDAVNYPSLYSIEYTTAGGVTHKADVINIDPVHDLALIRSAAPGQDVLRLGEFKLKKGEKIFSFGNPYDMGLIIVEGLYNGLVDHARYPKILFSGSINPGMSGGPAMNQDGSVIGVNVATAGNDISFFVPVDYLNVLVDELNHNSGKSFGPDWRGVIGRRLTENQDRFIKNLTGAQPWPKRQIGTFRVPSEISGEFKCWAKSGENERFWVSDTYLNCSTSDNIYISDTLRTGIIDFGYEWYSSTGHDPVRFYNLFEKYAANKDFYFEYGAERDVGNFVCSQDFVDIQGRACKVESCARAYKSYTGLFDISAQVTTTTMPSRGLVININLMGVTEQQGNMFLRRFLKEVEWLD